MREYFTAATVRSHYGRVAAARKPFHSFRKSLVDSRNVRKCSRHVGQRQQKNETGERITTCGRQWGPAGWAGQRSTHCAATSPWD
jgi:hypothetical protein